MSAMPLPQALKPWHDLLSWFAPELQESLGRMLQQLHHMLGPLQPARRGEMPEPGGVDDLHRRGRYERLLSSEWLLASDLPDEFLRRAATGEHLFLAPRQVSQRVQRTLVAVFDAGPMQWGAPRLAHIALWILLARRASQAGGQLRWAVAQQPRDVHDARSEDDLRRLLAARTFAPVAGVQWARWAEALDGHEDGAAEYWFVGHDVAALPRGGRCPAHTVQLRRGLRGDALDVTTCVHGTVRTLPLPLPPQGLDPLLLKGRFQGKPAPQPASSSALQLGDRFSLQARPLIASNGNRVAVRLLDGHGMLIFNVPTESGRVARKPKRQQWSAQAEPLAAAFGGSSLGVLLHLPQALQFWQVPRFHMVPPRPPREQFEASPGRGRLLSMAWYNDPACTRAYVLDAGHRLVYWQVADLPAPVVALATCPAAEQIVLAGTNHPPERWHYRLPQRHLAARGEPLPPLGDAQPAVRLLHAQAGVVDAWLAPPDPSACADGGGFTLAWRCNGQSLDVPLPPGWPRAGTRLQAAAGGHWLMALLDDGTDGHCMLVGLSTGRLHAGLAWPGGVPTVVRIVDDACLLADAHGRLWQLDTATSEVRRLSLRA